MPRSQQADRGDALSVRFPLNRHASSTSQMVEPDASSLPASDCWRSITMMAGHGMYTDAWSAANPTALRLVSWLA